MKDIFRNIWWHVYDNRYWYAFAITGVVFVIWCINEIEHKFYAQLEQFKNGTL